ncbi:MAG: beta-N-acetylhexosaminidase [Alphaproteobacteria bacterium]|nr:beta-N-acetylhexosaminidase [Alphaproteobacteria bacterium]
MSENNVKRPKPIIIGCEGPELSATERSAFRVADPFGIILFKRNCQRRDQLSLLIREIKQAVGRDDIQFVIDQEGGRVSRLQPPEWVSYPPARAFGLMYERDPEWGMEAIKFYSRILAHELSTLGITINCAPVVDLFNAEGTPALGDRAYSSSPETVAALARAQVEVFLSNGILPVIKHLPGHGRLKVDPHEALPVIDAPRADLEAQDFVPFELMKDVPLGMNSHAVFKALDPGLPASMSAVVNREVIRGKLGFDGLLLSDDLQMGALKNALKGSIRELSARALEAGNDIVLVCEGDPLEIAAIARDLPPMSEKSWERFEHAQRMVSPPEKSYSPSADVARLDVLLGGLAFEQAM